MQAIFQLEGFSFVINWFYRGIIHIQRHVKQIRHMRNATLKPGVSSKKSLKIVSPKIVS